jgi:DNA polymerase-4
MTRTPPPPRLLPSTEPPQDTGCTILHIDMDAFYASVSLLEHPHLKGRPVIVGGGGNRGVVLSATYEARAFGVHAAMPMTRARRLCPQATVLAADHRRYSAVSAAVLEVFRSVTPLVEPLSLDEAFLDVSGATRRLGSPAEIVVPRDGVIDFLHPLPVSALWGVGERTEEILVRFGLHTVGDLANTPVDTLRRALGPAAGPSLHALAWGRDERRVVAAEPDRSVGAEETFARDVDDPATVRRELLRLSERTAARLRAAGHSGRTVVLKVRFADFTTITRSRTLPETTDVARDIYSTACALYDALHLDRARLRLVGVRVEGVVSAAGQPHQMLLGARDSGWREAEQAVDRATDRFGSGAVRPATLVDQIRADGTVEPHRRPPR